MSLGTVVSTFINWLDLGRSGADALSDEAGFVKLSDVVARLRRSIRCNRWQLRKGVIPASQFLTYTHMSGDSLK